jgi:peptidyl-prolyl cis-trans isomerase SurA
MQLADRKQLEAKKMDWGYSEDAKIKSALMAAADSTLLSGKWRFTGDDAIKIKPIFSTSVRSFTLAEAIAFIGRHQSITTGPLDARMNDLYDAFVTEKIGELEEEDLYEKNSEYRSLLNEYKEGILLFTVMEKEVWNRDPADSVELRKFYEQTKGNYRAGERVHARILSTDKKSFDQVVQRLASGDSLRKDEVKKLKVSHGWHNFEKGENKTIDKVSWSLGPHAVENEGGYYLVEIDNLVPPGLKSFQDARTQVTSAYQEQVEKAWVAGLKEKYPVKVISKGRKAVMKELTSPGK